MQSDHIIRALSALAQEHRLAAFRALVQAGAQGISAGSLAEEIGVAASSMSFHLAQLGHAGLISQERRGRSLIYRADYPAMAGLMAYLTENCCGGGAVCLPEAACASSLETERNAA
jgi:ArsR family transcriptional regulator, arsenate/arsenite/antimonite-responsive transcriptional repressor